MMIPLPPALKNGNDIITPATDPPPPAPIRQRRDKALAAKEMKRYGRENLNYSKLY